VQEGSKCDGDCSRSLAILLKRIGCLCVIAPYSLVGIPP